MFCIELDLELSNDRPLAKVELFKFRHQFHENPLMEPHQSTSEGHQTKPKNKNHDIRIAIDWSSPTISIMMAHRHTKITIKAIIYWTNDNHLFVVPDYDTATVTVTNSQSNNSRSFQWFQRKLQDSRSFTSSPENVRKWEMRCRTRHGGNIQRCNGAPNRLSNGRKEKALWPNDHVAHCDGCLDCIYWKMCCNCRCYHRLNVYL